MKIAELYVNMLLFILKTTYMCMMCVFVKARRPGREEKDCGW